MLIGDCLTRSASFYTLIALIFYFSNESHYARTHRQRAFQSSDLCQEH